MKTSTPKLIILTLTLLLITGLISRAETIIPDGHIIQDECRLNNDGSRTYIDGSETWTATGSPYIVEGDVFVHSKLDIEPGTIVKFALKARIFVRDGIIDLPCTGSNRVPAIIEAIGTVANPIIFTSDKDDTHGGDSNNDGNASMPSDGYWDNIAFNDASGRKEHGEGVFRYCEFYYGGYHDYPLIIHDKGTVENCHFSENNHRVGLAVAFAATPTIANLTFGAQEYKGIGLVSNPDLNPTNINLPKYDDYPYIVTDLFLTPIIRRKDTVNVLQGTIFKFKDAGIDIQGQLNAQGVSEGEFSAPVVFTSIHDDRHGGDTDQTGNTVMPQHEDWHSIEVLRGVPNRNLIAEGTFEDCHFAYGGGGPRDVMLFIDGIGTVRRCHFESPVTPPATDKYVGIGVTIAAVHDIADLTFGSEICKGIGLSTHFGPNDINNNLPLNEQYPYVVNNTPRFFEGQTLNVQPGVTIKFFEGEAMNIFEGQLSCVGTAAQPIILTSIYDDNHYGDTNQDGTMTIPCGGDWDSLYFYVPQIIPFQHTQFLYVDKFSSDGTFTVEDDLNIEAGTSVTLNAGFQTNTDANVTISVTDNGCTNNTYPSNDDKLTRWKEPERAYYNSRLNILSNPNQSTPYQAFQLIENENKKVLQSSLVTYPNPTNGLLNISLDKSDSESSAIRLYDRYGSLVLAFTTQQEVLEVNLADLPVGIYTLEVISVYQKWQEKVVKF